MIRKVLLATIILAAFPFEGFAAERMVLVEMFTSTTCPPCVGGNASLNNYLAKHDCLIAVRYHMSWPSPGNDPFCHYNSANGARRSYYGDINAVPKFKMDGGGWPLVDEFILEHRDAGSTVNIKTTASFVPNAYNALQGQGSVTVELTNEDSKSISFVLFGALVESNVAYTGSNGDPIHHQVMIDMYPSSSGEPITLKGAETKVLTYDFVIDDTIPFLTGDLKPTGQYHVTDAGNCEIVFWCQLTSTKEIFQATIIPVSHGPLSAEVTFSEVDNERGKLSPGETSDFYVTLLNTSDWTWEEVTGVLSTEDEAVEIPDSVSTWSDIAPQEQGRNEDDPFQITLSHDGEEGYRPSLLLSLSCGKGPIRNQEAEFQMYEPVGISERYHPFSVNVPGCINKTGIITLSLPASLEGKIDLFDACGRKIKGIYSGHLSQGTNIIPLSANEITRGVYFVKINYGRYSKISKILVVH
ncbi:T9SS type A sorting domain-containing protein [candidate division WOR-3 bacterium]|nr:T9SS type A sorting domain-containing protein [candidate division WOR-3 bacterium]